MTIPDQLREYRERDDCLLALGLIRKVTEGTRWEQARAFNSLARVSPEQQREMEEICLT